MRNPTSLKQEAQELTPEQRLLALEADRPVLIEKIALCDKLQLQVNYVCSQLPAMQGYIKSLEDQQEAILRHISTFQDQLLSALNCMQEMKVKNSETIEKFSGLCKASSDSSQVAIGDLRSSLQSHKEETNNKVFKLASMEYVDSQDVQINGARAEGQMKLESTVEEVLRQMRELKQHVDRFFDITATKAFATMSSATVDSSLSERISKLEDSLKTPIENLTHQLSAVTMDVIMMKKNKQEPQELIDAAKQDLEHRLKLVTLDSSNASLRSLNSEQKIAMLERRIENIDLRVKKGEIKA